MIAIIDYGMGNLGSIENMLRKLNIACRIESHPEKLHEAKGLILPGVGHFDRGMVEIRNRGIDTAIDELVRQGKTPMLGVCLGMQLLCNSSTEGTEAGLGLLDAHFESFESAGEKSEFKKQHMGWNRVELRQRHPLFEAFDDQMRFYFVHGFFCVTANKSIEIGSTNYGKNFTSAIAKNNVMGVQFHPEKSHRFGMQLYRNFSQIVENA